MDKNGPSCAETTHGSSGAAKYLANQLHLRPVDNQRGVDAPKIIANSNHVPSAATTSASFQGSQH